MPRYYYDVFNDDVTMDEEGTELPSLDAAMERARVEARGLAADSITRSGHLVLNHYIRIRDANGGVVSNVRFGDAVEVR